MPNNTTPNDLRQVHTSGSILYVKRGSGRDMHGSAQASHARPGPRGAPNDEVMAPVPAERHRVIARVGTSSRPRTNTGCTHATSPPESVTLARTYVSPGARR